MISLRKSVTELERLEELHRKALNCYSGALRSTEQNAIELDAAEAAHFRTQLQALRDQLKADAATSELEAVQSSFEVELKDYHDKASGQIRHLRQEVQAAAAAVETFAGSITESEVNLDSGIQRELNSLNKSASSNDIEAIRGAIHASTAKIAADLKEMRSSNQLAIAQLKDEIRLLHQQVRSTRRSQAPDPLEGSPQINGRMQEFIQRKTPFSVLLVVIRNWEGLQNCYAADTIEGALRGFQSRFENILPSSALVGRWAKNQFAAILSTAPSNAMEMSREVVRKLSEPVMVQDGVQDGEQEKGATRSIAFNSQAGVIEFGRDSDLAKFQARLKQLADALAG
jgi:GGDEF domain-containing protein